MLDTIAPTAFADLAPVEPDALLALISLCNADPRPEKIDVGVGVYRDAAGNTPILRAVKQAERRLWDMQQTKGYLGSRGDERYARLLRPIVLGRHADDERIDGVQTPGGCGALRLGFMLIAAANSRARVLIGTPTWPNHPPIVKGCGLEVVNYPFYDAKAGAIRFDAMMDALQSARAGDIALLHGCCHNPTGADLDPQQWQAVTRVIAERGIIPFVDLAYQGLAHGLEQDAEGLWGVLDACDQALVAQSCDKNFGLYRDRVGTLFVKAPAKETTATAMGHVLRMAREMWSMPPDHGAAVVRLVLEDSALTEDWRAELATMRERLNGVRAEIARADPRLAYIGGQYGMFSMLPLSVEQVRGLRSSHGIYMADSGRFNVVGMGDEELTRFLGAVREVMDA